MKHPEWRLAAGLAAALCLTSAQPAFSQAFPSRPITFISTLQPVAIEGPLRAWLMKMAETFGQPVVLDVKAGGAGVVGAQALMRAPPDGYTIMFTMPNTIATTPYLVTPKPYDPSDFTPITEAIGTTLGMVVTASLPVSSVSELIAYIKANPGKLAYGSNGVGGSYHLMMELIKANHGLDITHVPFKGGAQSLLAVVGGHTPIGFSPVSAVTPHVKTGKLRILAVLDTRRSSSYPDIPAITEQLPDYDQMPANLWIFAPKGMPAPLANRLQSEIAKAIHAPEVADRMNAIAFIPMGTTPAEAAAQLKKYVEASIKAIKAGNIRAD